MNTKKYILVLLAGLFFSVNAHADWYVGADAGLGNMNTDKMKLYVNSTDLTSQYSTPKTFDTGMIGIFSGYQFNDDFRLEGKYSYIQSEDKTTRNNTFTTFSVKIAANVHKFTMGAYYDYHLNDKSTIFAGAAAGASYIIVPTTVKDDVTLTYGYNDTKDTNFNFTWDLSVGTSYSLTKNTELILQYTYTDVGNVDWKTTGGNGIGGTANFSGNTKMSFSILSLGMRYKF
jgi:opacity protein-like surface antigen